MARNRVLLKYICFFLFCYFYNLCIIYLFFALTAVLDVRCYLFENKLVFTNVSSIINYWSDSCSGITDSECTDYPRNNQIAGRLGSYAVHTMYHIWGWSKYQTYQTYTNPTKPYTKWLVLVSIVHLPNLIQFIHYTKKYIYQT